MTTRRQLREARRRRSHRLRAVLAAGAVLGVGAAATLAAWNDSEFASGDFTASVFGIVGSDDGVTFGEHAELGNAAVLQLPAPASAMSPGSEIYALYSVRTIPASVGGTVLLTADDANDHGLGEYLEYSVRTISGITCNQTAFAAGSSAGLPQGQALTVDASASQILAAGGAQAVNFCFRVTLPTGASNDAQGASLTARWVFEATSS